MGERPSKDEPIFDPWRPTVIAGREHRPAAPRTPTFFEQRRIDRQTVARLFGAPALRGDGVLDFEPPRGLMSEAEEASYYNDYIDRGLEYRD